MAQIDNTWLHRETSVSGNGESSEQTGSSVIKLGKRMEPNDPPADWQVFRSRLPRDAPEKPGLIAAYPERTDPISERHLVEGARAHESGTLLYIQMRHDRAAKDSVAMQIKCKPLSSCKADRRSCLRVWRSFQPR